MFDDDALTAEEVAEMLRVSKNFVYRLARSGELASYRVGRKLRFTLRDVETYTRASLRASQGAPTPRNSLAPQRFPGSCPTASASSSPAVALESANGIPRAFSLDNREPFVIAGNDVSGDIIAHALAASGLPVSRAYVGSYTALVNLYGKRTNATRSMATRRRTREPSSTSASRDGRRRNAGGEQAAASASQTARARRRRKNLRRANCTSGGKLRLVTHAGGDKAAITAPASRSESRAKQACKQQKSFKPLLAGLEAP